ncbi:MAG: ACP S-malonyltransferase [Clostridiales bacterium]|nr:ACP S-malonyltransferase [Clostridiales bacterium]
MTDIGFLFPGQGAQTAGMGEELYRSDAAFRDTFDAVCEAVSMDLRAVCFKGERIDETAFTQPALYAVSVSTLMSLRAAGVVPARCAGLSLGEYAALAAAGALDIMTGARLVRRRGELMGRMDGAGGLAVAAGLPRERVCELVERHFAGRRLYLANDNLPAQQVVGGETELLDEFCRLALEAGAALARPLNTSGPFHTPMMRGAGDELLSFMNNNIVFSAASVTVYSNVLGAPYGAEDDIAALLARQVYEQVRWRECLEGMMASDRLLEVGPGSTLGGMARRMDRRKPCLPVCTPAGLEAAAALVNRKEGVS